MNVIREDKAHNFMLFRSEMLRSNFDDFVSSTYKAYDRFRYNFTDRDSTRYYRYYNAFSLAAGCEHYYKLFAELKSNIRYYCQRSDPLWIQAWLNVHRPDEVLDWHSHYESIFHGYISVDPKSSVTEFEKFSIENEIGNIYIGPSSLKHRVSVSHHFDGYRLTVGFDVFDMSAMRDLEIKYGPDVNIAMIPI